MNDDNSLNIKQEKSEDRRISSGIKKKFQFIKKKSRGITLQEFSYVYNNKIKSELKDKGKMTFEDVNVLLNAYEFYRYEMVS